MKIIRKLSLFSVVLALIGLAAAFAVEASYASKGQVIQRIAPYEPAVAEMLGEKGELVGSPQKLIITDRAAFLPGKSSSGAALVDDSYLKKQGIYPLQVKTVHYVAGLAKLGLLAMLAIGGMMLVVVKRCSRCAVSRPSLIPIS